MSKTSPPDLSLCTWPGWSYLILTIPPLLVIIAVHIYLLVDVVCEYSALELDEIRLSPHSIILYVFMIAPCLLSIVQGYRASSIQDFNGQEREEWVASLELSFKTYSEKRLFFGIKQLPRDVAERQKVAQRGRLLNISQIHIITTTLGQTFLGEELYI